MMTVVRRSVLLHSLSGEEGTQKKSCRQYLILQFCFSHIFSKTLFFRYKSAVRIGLRHTSYDREKSFPSKKPTFFSFKCLICDFSQNFLLYNSVWIRTFFGFGSSLNIRILSDSDPQHWLARTHTRSLQ
jgi:hypothetical protein